MRTRSLLFHEFKLIVADVDGIPILASCFPQRFIDAQLAHLAEITGVKTTGSDAEKANAFIAAIRQMNREMGLPTGFDFIEQKDFPQIIKWALAEGNGTYPVPVIYNEARMRHVLNRIVLEA
jgi:alcohol dehydrogenase class IV